MLVMLISCFAQAQEIVTETTDTTCVQKDIGDVIRAARHKPPKPEEVGKPSLFLIPIIGSNPATGFMLGVGGQYAFKMPGEETKYSMISGSVQFTTKNQKLFLIKNNIYTKNNKIFFSGDWRYLIFSQSTYGLGTNAPEGGVLDYQYDIGGQNTSNDSLAQPMNYNFVRFYQAASFRIFAEKSKGLFLGFGYCLDKYSKIEDLKLNLTPGEEVITSHYAYNTKYGFSTSGYSLSTLNVNVVSDTRDNMINPYSGHFLQVTFRSGLKFLGNDEASSFLYTEWRSYHRLSAKNPRHLIAFWATGEFTPSGKYPYMILPALGYDQRSRSGRGYTQGRFRGNNLVYGESEYRFPISKCGGVTGGVLFLNATTASNPVTGSAAGYSATSLKLFESVKPGYGFGLRFMVDKKTRTNLAVDFGFGDKSSGFYLAASETF